MLRTTPTRRTLRPLAAASLPLVALGACSHGAPQVRAAAAAAPSPLVLVAEVEPTPARTAPPAAAMPRGDLPGWKQVAAEDFSGSALPEGWGAYDGTPGGNAHGRWHPARVRVSGGSLRLAGAWAGGRYTTGGVMSWAARTHYGKYEVRFRVSRAAGASYALLLWPSRGSWPTAGEVDFAEDGGGRRRTTTATVHYGRDDRTVQRHVNADFSRWQTVGVEWTPGRLVYTLNGRAWGTVEGDAVPSGPMDLALQLEAGRGSAWAPAPTRRTPASTLEVDWAVAYRRA